MCAFMSKKIIRFIFIQVFSEAEGWESEYDFLLQGHLEYDCPSGP